MRENRNSIPLSKDFLDTKHQKYGLQKKNVDEVGFTVILKYRPGEDPVTYPRAYSQNTS